MYLISRYFVFIVFLAFLLSRQTFSSQNVRQVKALDVRVRLGNLVPYRDRLKLVITREEQCNSQKFLPAIPRLKMFNN